MTNSERSHILIVDDNDDSRMLLCRRLEQLGFEVVEAPSGEQAIDLVKRGSFDLVLLDVVMPGLSGLDVLKALRKDLSTTQLPIIMATANDRSEDVVTALDLGANDYVTKPTEFTVVAARIQSQLRQKAAASNRARVGGDEPASGPGAVIAGKYRLEEHLGSGSFGSVYKAQHLDLEQSVAVKILQSTGGPKSSPLLRFRREGISACRVKHPNAVSVLDFGITEVGTAYLVMELLEGRSLAEELAEKKNPVPDSLRSDPASDLRRAGRSACRRHGPSGHQAREHLFARGTFRGNRQSPRFRDIESTW